MRGRLILCRYVETEDTLPGGKIALLQGSKDALTSQQGIVEAVGPGERDEDGDWVPMDPGLVKGAWVVHRAFARKPWPDPSLFLLHADDVIAIMEAP